MCTRWNKIYIVIKKRATMLRSTLNCIPAKLSTLQYYIYKMTCVPAEIRDYSDYKEQQCFERSRHPIWEMTKHRLYGRLSYLKRIWLAFGLTCHRYPNNTRVLMTQWLIWYQSPLESFDIVSYSRSIVTRCLDHASLKRDCCLKAIWLGFDQVSKGHVTPPPAKLLNKFPWVCLSRSSNVKSDTTIG